jgi:hypothetical protein
MNGATGPLTASRNAVDAVVDSCVDPSLNHGPLDSIALCNENDCVVANVLCVM